MIMVEELGDSRCRRGGLNGEELLTGGVASNVAVGHVPRNPPVTRRNHFFRMGHTVFEVNRKYIPLKELGNGAYGVVCSAHDRLTKVNVAIKKVTNVFENVTDGLRILREMILLRHMNHKNIIALKDIMLPDQKTNFKDAYLVYELMDTDLNRIVRSPQKLSNDHIQYFMLQLLRGVEYLHSSNILHRDLKPGNLLINADCELKICDFGLARTKSSRGDKLTEYVVTRWYRASELLLSCDNYGGSIDIWSVGCILAELLGRKPLFPGKGTLHQLQLIHQILGTPHEDDLLFVSDPKARNFIKKLPRSYGVDFFRMYPGADPLAIDLLKKMLTFDPSKRITAKEALNHPYFNGLNSPVLFPPAIPKPIEIVIDESYGEQRLRETMWCEMLHYHPELTLA
ncbi:Mitogen-activated protein kinase 3-like protein [Drosera capensis]